ncbi:MAG: hypothetical protein IJQ02_05465 [Oscillospiraceae bacterium]|nr:hypothetical protein [Oscillospiraceae bacterium]MBR0393061.1 hypothetical protein [Oscillospiraceae bacterium]
MKCPRCGAEMTLDTHRKIPLNMCYDCGYIEGRSLEESSLEQKTNFAHLKALDLRETAAFLSKGLSKYGIQVDEKKITAWLKDPMR